MKNCSYCGKENEDGATHCHECGTGEFQPTSEGQTKALASIDLEADERFVPRALSEEERTHAFVTLRRCRTLQEADFLVASLRSAGFEASIPDENLMQSTGFNLNTYGYVRVTVPTVDYDKIAQFLAEELVNAIEPEEARLKLHRAQEPLSTGMKLCILCLPMGCLPALIIAAMIRSHYLKQGYQRRADEVWRFILIGIGLWTPILALATVLSRR